MTSPSRMVSASAAEAIFRRPLVEKASTTARVTRPSTPGSRVRFWKMGTAIVLMSAGSVPLTL